MKKITLALAFTVVFIVGGFAQKNLLKEADLAFGAQEYFTAIDWYKKAYVKEKKAEKKAKILFRTAECYRHINDLNEAITFYLKAMAAKYPDPKCNFYIGEMKKEQKLYTDAISYFQNYKKEVPSDAAAENEIKSCELAQKWVDNPTRHKLDDMMFNDKEADYSPAFSDKKNTTLWFTSTRSGATGDGKADGTTGDSHSDVFETKLGKDGKWSTPTPLGAPVNSNVNEGCAVIDKKGTFMIFTRCGEAKKKQLKCQLMIANKQGPSWQEPTPISFDIDSFQFNNPALSPDGNTLYFSSNMTGGKGHYDIWKSTYSKKEKSWGAPVNLGASVNTAGNEGFPYMHANGKTLYFSSDTWLGMGGLDIYKIDADKGGVFSGSAENLKYPMNSPWDDFGIVYDGNKDRGYLSSSREGGKGEDDIWSFYLPPLVFNATGTVTGVDDKGNKCIVPNCPIIIKGSDGTLAQVTTDKDGNYSIPLKPDVSYEVYPQTGKDLTAPCAKHGFLGSEDKGKFTTVGIGESTNFKKEFSLSIVPEGDIKFPAVLYALGKAELLVDPTGTDKANDTHKPLNSKDSLNSLYKTLIDNPTIIIELSAHTDSRGDNKSNEKLSQARAQSCVDYLISKGIPTERMKAVGYGERKLKISDAQIAKAKTKEEKEALHQINRRTVFKIISWDYLDPKAPKTDIPKYHPKVSGDEDSNTIEDAPGGDK